MKLLSFEDSQGSAYGTFLDKALINLVSLVRAYETDILKKPLLSSSDIVEFLAREYWESTRLAELLHFLHEGRLQQNPAVTSGYRMLAPVPRPPKILALGRTMRCTLKKPRSQSRMSRLSSANPTRLSLDLMAQF